MLRSFTATACAFILAGTAFSQTDPEVVFLEKCICDEYEFKSVSDFRAVVNKAMEISYADWMSKKGKSEAEGGFSIPLAKLLDLKFSASGKEESEEFRRLKQLFKANEGAAWSSAEMTAIRVRLINPKALETYQEVWGAMPMRVSIKGAAGKRNEEFIASVQYTPKSEGDPREVTISNVVVVGATPVGEPALAPKVSFGRFSGVSQVYRRKGGEPVTIVVDFKGFRSRFATLPEVPPVVRHVTLTGIWLLDGQTNKITAAVQRPSGRLVLINEWDGRTSGAMTGPDTLVAVESGEWSPQLTAVIKDKGKVIRWSSGVSWERAGDQPGTLTGIWYLNGRADKACVAIQRADKSISLFNEHDGRTNGAMTGPKSLVAHASNEWSSITGEVEGDGQVIRWSSGVTWERQPKAAK